MVRLISFLILTLCLTSCFDIIEQLTFNKDKSGEAKYTLNLMNQKDWVNTVFQSDTLYGHKVPSQSEIISRLEGQKSYIDGFPGISNYQTDINFETCLFTISFHFDSIRAISAMAESIADSAKTPFDMKMFPYMWLGNSFYRLNQSPVKKDHPQIQKYLPKIGDANLISIFKFEDEIAESTNQNAMIGKSKKSCFLKVKLSDVIANPQLIENKITLVQ